MRKSITFQHDGQGHVSVANDFQKESERLFSIQADSTENSQSEVKVIYRTDNGETWLRTPKDKITTSLIKNVVLRKWKNVANIVLRHKDMEPFLRTALTSKVCSEFKQYCAVTNSILKGTSPEELAAYSNRFVCQEVKVMCSFWFAGVVGACGVHKCPEKELKASNAIALVTSAASRSRNQRMSALAARISVILLHSGAKTHDFTRLNKLGVSLSHKQSIRLQRSMGLNFDGKVLSWKKKREELLGARKLCQEILARQIPVFEEDDMELEIWCDLSICTTQSYRYFSSNAHLKLMEVVNTCKTESDSVDSILDSTMQVVLAKLEERETPSYR